MPITALMTPQKMPEAITTKIPTAMTPMSCAMSSFRPPPKRRPLPVVFGRELILGEQADAERAEHAVDQVDRGGADRIVDLDLVEADDGQHDEHAGDGADDAATRRR